MKRLQFTLTASIVVALLPCSILTAQQPTAIADKIEPINPNKQQQQLQQLQQQNLQNNQDFLPNRNRSPFLDTLFNIPIQTLRAVNELVQGIAGSVQGVVASSQRRPPPLRFQQRQVEQDENANTII